jgi:hypothetical protein
MIQEQYVFDSSLSKRPCIYKRVGSAVYPVLYFQKAKYADDQEFMRVLKISMPSLNEKKK